MTAVFMRSLAPENPDGPPLLFVHGAANSSDVWFRWMDSLSALGWATHALDLRGHGNSGPAHDVNLGMVTMADYVADVEEAASRLDAPPVIIGWSMGGLIAQMFEAANRAAPGMILLAPSPPAAVESGRSTDGIDDVYGSEFYGIDPNRKGGGPVLLVFSRHDRLMSEATMRRMAEVYGMDQLEVPGRVGHWGLVAGPRVPQMAVQVDAWLRTKLEVPRSTGPTHHQ